jgi:hypothetical protein
MKTIRLLFVFSALSVMLLLPVSIYACGGFETFNRQKQSTHSTDNTNVFVSFKNEKETFIIQPDFEGNAKDFAAVFPFPAKPEITEVSETFFPDLQSTFNMGTLPVFGALEGSLKSGARGVQVIEKKDVGDFETTTLTATSSEELVKWLKDHQYNYSEKDQENFDYYVQKKNSYFVALKIKMDSFNGSLKPIGFVFDTNVPVIAMKISASDMKAMKYTLYTAGESMFFVPGTPLYNSKKVLKKDIDANPGIKNYIAANDWVTQAIVTMDPSRIQEDLIITEAVEPEPVAGKTIILNPGMIPSAAGIVLGVSTTNKKNISVMKNAPTLTPMPPTSTPTPATVTEKTQQQIISHRYTSVVFWVIIIVGLIVEAGVGVLLFILLRKKQYGIQR